MKLGVVGLPNVGKSTLFNAITQAGAEAANYPFCTIEPNTGVVAVPDRRLDVLTEMYPPKKTTPAAIEFVDIAGLVKGASRGEGLGNKFLSHIREVDAIVHVVRCFEDENIVHVNGRIDPADDIATINLELILADLETVQKRGDKARKMIKSGEKRYAEEADLADRIAAHLEKEQPVRTFPFTEEERAYCDKCARPAEHYAARFAAREAVVKALGTGFADGVGFRDVSVGRDDSGRPRAILTGRAEELAREKGIREIALSISHTHDVAVANAIAVTDDVRPEPSSRQDAARALASSFKEARSVLDELERVQEKELSDLENTASTENEATSTEE